MALLKEDGNIPSESERFMILMIGGSRESMHDFRSFVGIRSSEHVEFEEERSIADFKGGSWQKIRKKRGSIGGRRIKI